MRAVGAPVAKLARGGCARRCVRTKAGGDDDTVAGWGPLDSGWGSGEREWKQTHVRLTGGADTKRERNGAVVRSRGNGPRNGPRTWKELWADGIRPEHYWEI